ncbi:MAG: metallophosphoesterase [Phycisphaerales bacterium]
MGKTANRLTGGRLQRAATRTDPRLVHHEITCPLWPAALDGLVVGHVSDFHLGELISLDQSFDVLRRLKEWPLDLLVVTGDIIDFHPHGAEPLLEALASYETTLGTWSVLGNHDKLVDERIYLDACERAGLRTLINERIDLEHRGGRIRLSGIDWARRPSEIDHLVDQVCEPCPEDGHILLAHHPIAFDRARSKGVDLTLSGHTHGGQLNLTHGKPWKPPVGLGSLAHKYCWGVYERDDSVLHVTSGVGSWFPFRVRCPSEIAIITVRSGRTASDQTDA